MMKRILIAAAVVLMLLAGIGAGFYLYRKHQARDIHGSSTVEFVPTAVPKPVEQSVSGKIEWPTYGFDNERLRAVDSPLRPSNVHRRWVWHGQALLEFPPAVAYQRLFLTTFDGRFYVLNAANGTPVWRWVSGRCGWASPAVAGRLVYVTFIGYRNRCHQGVPGPDGELDAFAADSKYKRFRWRFHLGPTESSPLVDDKAVYVGDWKGDVYAIDRFTGKQIWKFHTKGKIKGSAASSGTRLYVGSYDGHVYCLNKATGKLLWRASAQPRFGSTGTFYATPALAYGRVFIGSTDGKEYAYGATTGHLLWSHQTGGYVYASAAVADKEVLVGSYDNRFYALDAATGNVDWSFRADGPISGSATVIGPLVYFSTFKTTTYALDVKTGRLVWTFPDGKYSPVVADPTHLYVVGLGKLYAFYRPVPSPPHAVRRHRSSRVHRVAPRRRTARKKP